MKPKAQGETNRRPPGQIRWPILESIAWPKREYECPSAFQISADLSLTQISRGDQGPSQPLAFPLMGSQRDDSALPPVIRSFSSDPLRRPFPQPCSAALFLKSLQRPWPASVSMETCTALPQRINTFSCNTDKTPCKTRMNSQMRDLGTLLLLRSGQ